MENVRSLVLVVNKAKYSTVVNTLKEYRYHLTNIYQSEEAQELEGFIVASVNFHLYHAANCKLDAYQVLDTLLQNNIVLDCQVGVIDYPMVEGLFFMAKLPTDEEGLQRIMVLQRLLPAYPLPKSLYWEKHFMTFPCHCRSYQTIAQKSQDRMPKKATYGWFGKITHTFQRMAAIF